jgi:hypothetical protein
LVRKVGGQGGAHCGAVGPRVDYSHPV